VLDQAPALSAAFAGFGVALFVTTAWVIRRSARRLQDELDDVV
jgi:hypothetical protein